MPLVIRRGAGAHADGRRGAVKRSAFDGAAYHQVVAAPAMVRAIAVRCQRAAKVRRGKGCDFVSHAQLHCRVVKRGHGIADLAQHCRVLGNQVVVQIKAANRYQKHLPLGTQAGSCPNQTRHDFELVCQ